VQFRLAREVQERFYEAPAPLSGIDIAAAAHPAEQTGGDYFDVIQDQNDDLYIAIGDVSGHGLDSALVMALTRAYVRSFVTMGLDVAEILKRANGMLAVDLGNNRYVTVLLVLLDTRHGTLRYASAGHVPGFLMTNSGDVKAMLDSTGLPLGLFPNAEFESRELQLKSEEILILCTDGAEETTTREGVEFGCERMLQYVRNHANDTAQEIAEGIYQGARCFARDEAQHDDITSVILKMTPPPRP
jgi:sigma-B regulation protein RsbU (phosphoserine phosphatase)